VSPLTVHDPDLGSNAIAAIGEVLIGIANLDQRLRFETAPHQLLGNPAIHCSIISGGQELSSFPERCNLSLERRTIPAETTEAVLAEIRELVGETVELTATFARTPLETPSGAPIVQVVCEICGSHGLVPELIGVGGWTDAALFDAQGIPSILIGPGGERSARGSRVGRPRGDDAVL